MKPVAAILASIGCALIFLVAGCRGEAPHTSSYEIPASPPVDIVLRNPRSVVGEQELLQRYDYWINSAFVCRVPLPGGGETIFASGQMNDPGDPRNPCNDNDELLFNGLLCAGGESRGCFAVRQSLDLTTGQWYRNPQYRIRRMADPAGGGDFSPDMALGVQLYTLKTKDKANFYRWLFWLDSINPCHNWLGGGCVDVDPPLFCPGNSNCAMRPGDASTLALTVEAMERWYGMPGLDHLPNQKLRGYLATWKGWGGTANFWGGFLAKPGFSQHIGYAAALIHSALGQGDLAFQARLHANDPENVTQDATGRRVGNAFYDFMGGQSRQQVVDDILYSCPSEANDSRALPSTWHWEDVIREPSYWRPNLWDCIFAASLIGVSPPVRPD